MSRIPQSTTANRYKQLLRVLQELASILNTESLLERIAHSAAKLSDAEFSWILFPDQINSSLFFNTSNFPINTHHLGFSAPVNASLEGWVFTNTTPVMVNDSSLYDLRFGHFIYLPGLEVKSLLAIPIMTRGKCIGVLEVINKRTQEFTQIDQEILVSFANQVAIYIENTHRFLQSDLVTELVHELHTPLAGLNTALYLLQRPDLPADRREQLSQMIHNEFNRLSELTTSFLDYARMESGRTKIIYSQFDFIQLIKESIDIFQMQMDGKDMKISIALPAEALVINADKDKIKQVILNMLSNADKYNHPGGIIKVSVNSSLVDVSFSIQDSGPGIPPEYLPRLFERFYRIPSTEKGVKGTGLGLTICKQIVEAHKGKIEVTSTVGNGSIFTVFLPYKQEA